MTDTTTTATLKKLEKVAKALGDANRLKILGLIASHGGIGACAAVQECVELAQPSVSHHIKILIESGLIDAHKEGRTYHYSLNKAALKEYIEALAAQTRLGES